MKKPTDKMQRRKLVLRRETITELTPLQLERVAGGWTFDPPCPPWGSQMQYTCAPDQQI
jgi:hypothetical protein